MSDVFALDARGQQALEDEARANPLDPQALPLPMWEGVGSQFKQLLRPSASAGRSLGMAVGGVAVIADTAYNAVTGESGTPTADLVFKHVVDDIGQDAVDYWTPDARASGAAANTLGTVLNVAGSLPQIVGLPGVFLTDAAIAPATDVVREGGGPGAALGVGAVSLGVNALGMRLPASWGSQLATRLATGAGANVALGAGQNLATQQILDAEGLDEFAASYDPLNPQSLLLDTLMGAAFGWRANLDAPDAPLTPSQRDAVLTARNADNFANRSLPGEPRDAAAALNHQAAMELSVRQLSAGEQLNVVGRVDLDQFALRPGMQTPASEGYGRMLVALESAGRPNARATTSSATGLHQFTDATWLSTVDKARPAWAEGLDKAELLAARMDPAKSTQMEAVLRAENAQRLARVGQDADAFNLYAMHHFGGRGLTFAKAGADTPMAEILTAGQLKANPYLQGLTKAQAIANWTQRARRAGVNVDGSLVDTDPAGQALRARLVEDPEQLMRDYAGLKDSKGGTVLNTDTARELSPEYLADRTRSADVHEAASDTIKTLYEAKLAQPTPEGFEPKVLFTAGGTGAGKTTAIQDAGEAFGRPEITYDTNMNTLASAVDKVEQALAAGREVHIAYVYREPVEALTGGAIPRAQRQAQEFGTGRTVPLEEHARTHAGVRPVVESLRERYANDPRVEFTAIDNSHGKGNARIVDLADVPHVEENRLRENLTAALEEARTAGLDDRLYQGFAAAGRSRPDAQAVRAAPGAGDGGRSEPGNRGQVSPAESPVQAAATVAAQSPDTPVIDGFDADGNPRYRALSEALADIEAERAQAQADAAGIAAAANCFIRRGDAS